MKKFIGYKDIKDVVNGGVSMRGVFRGRGGNRGVFWGGNSGGRDVFLGGKRGGFKN